MASANVAAGIVIVARATLEVAKGRGGGLGEEDDCLRDCNERRVAQRLMKIA